MVLLATKSWVILLTVRNHTSSQSTVFADHSDAEPRPFPVRRWDHRRADLRRHCRDGDLHRSETAGNQHPNPAGSLLQAAALTMARRASESGNPAALFLDMLAAERGAGKNTLDAYGRDLADLDEYLGEHKRTLARASTDDLRDYLAALAQRGLSAASVARRLSAVRQFYRFLYGESHRGDDPAAILE